MLCHRARVDDDATSGAPRAPAEVHVLEVEGLEERVEARLRQELAAAHQERPTEREGHRVAVLVPWSDLTRLDLGSATDHHGPVLLDELGQRLIRLLPVPQDEGRDGEDIARAEPLQKRREEAGSNADVRVQDAKDLTRRLLHACEGRGREATVHLPRDTARRWELRSEPLSERARARVIDDEELPLEPRRSGLRED